MPAKNEATLSINSSSKVSLPTLCRGCKLDCVQCPWAFPESFAPIKMLSTDIQRVRELALKNGISPDALLSEIVDRYFEGEGDRTRS